MGALDFGLLLEGTLVIVESVFGGIGKRAELVGMERFNSSIKLGIIKKSVGSVATYVFFAQLILIVALLPIFSFQQVEGKMFSPLAFTLGYALLGSLILSLTYVPAMCKVLLRRNIREKENFISNGFHRGASLLFEWSQRHRRLTLVGFSVLVVGCGVRFLFYGSEFIPSLNEGAIYVRATLPNSVNLDESVRLANEMRQKLRAFEEVEFVMSQTGRPNDGTDPTGFFNVEFHIQLFPESDWKRKVNKDQLL